MITVWWKCKRSRKLNQDRSKSNQYWQNAKTYWWKHFCLLIRWGHPSKYLCFPLPDPFKKRRVGQSVKIFFFFPQRRLMNSKMWETAAAWQNQQNDLCAQRTQIRLGIHPIWSVFAVRMKKPWDLSYSMSISEDWSDWADAQADLSLCLAHRKWKR